MLNLIWTSFFLAAALSGLFNSVFLHDPEVFNRIMQALFSTARTGFEISLGLTGVMCLWLGLMRIGEAAGAISLISRIMSPLLARLFPEIPRDHPAFGSMVMNLSANVLGLDNAATPLGLKAMRDLQDLNPEPERASNAQIMFLVINTSSVTLIPVTIFTYLYQLGYPDPTELFIPILLATSLSSLAGLLAVAAYQRLNLFQPVILAYLGGFFGLLSLLVTYLLTLDREDLQLASMLTSNILIFGVIVLFMAMALWKKLNVYEEFIRGAREGFGVAVQIIPFLVAMLVAIGVFRASGGLDLLLHGLASFFQAAGLFLDRLGLISYHGQPLAFIDALPTGLLKPLSGSGARGMMIETIQNHGVGHLTSKISAVMQGSTETTFYIIAVYFGSVGIRQTRHAVPCGLLADFTGLTAAIAICYLFFG